MVNQKGVTLSELITSVGIMSLIMVIAASILFYMNFSYLTKKDRFDAEEAAAKAELLLKLVFSQAVDIQEWGGGPGLPLVDVAPNLAGASGQVATGIIDRLPAQQWLKIAAFQREVQGNTAVTHGMIARTAIWFRRPEIASGGVLFIDLGVPRIAVNAEPAPIGMQATYNDDFIPRISHLEIIEQATNNYGKLASLEFRMRFRYHTKSSSATTWCPRENLPGGAAPIGGCNVPGAQWQDLDRRFTILLRNNLIRTALNASRVGTGGGAEERVLGNLYFFAPYLPGERR